MMPTPEEVRKKILGEKKKNKEEIISLKEKIKILTEENENFKNSFFCPNCGAKLEKNKGGLH